MATLTERLANLLALIQQEDAFEREQVPALDREVEETTERLKIAQEADNLLLTSLLRSHQLMLTESRIMYAMFSTMLSLQVHEQVLPELAQLEASLRARLNSIQ